MRNFFLPSQIKKQKLLSLAARDSFFELIVHDIIDYGLDLRFRAFGGAGAYRPYALRTEPLDGPETLKAFQHAMGRMFGTGQVSVRIRLSCFASEGVAVHSFLHELMHFYQDMHGLYFMPIEEERVFPVILDARSHVMCVLFNEAWAQVEAIRASYSLARKANKTALWDAALKHRDFGYMAHQYADDLDGGVPEARVAANIFMSWYQDKHCAFYEAHALRIYRQNFERYEEQADFHEDFLRSLELPMLVARLPQGQVPQYFEYLDWGAQRFQPHIDLSSYAVSDHPNVQDIKSGAPPYLWNMLRNMQARQSEIPAAPVG